MTDIVVTIPQFWASFCAGAVVATIVIVGLAYVASRSKRKK